MPRARRHAKEIPRGTSALERRREQVASLSARGFSAVQIARAIDVSHDTVSRDLIKVRPVLRKALGERAEDIYADGAAEYEEVRRELWLNYAGVPSVPDNQGLRMAILQAIASLPEKRARLGQSLGLVVQAPERVEVVQRLERAIADAMSRQPPEEAERLIGEIRKAAATR